MPQLSFAMNFYHMPSQFLSVISSGTIHFWAFNLYDSISFNTVNMQFRAGAAGEGKAETYSLGLYSFTGSTLTLINSISRSSSWAGPAGRGPALRPGRAGPAPGATGHRGR